MADPTAQVTKQIGEAKKAAKKLEGEIAKALKGVKKGNFEPQKALAAAKKIRAFMSRFKGLARVSGSPVYAGLPPEAQAGVDWMDSMMADMLSKSAGLIKAAKLAKMEPDKPVWIKTVKVLSREAKAEMGGFPPGVGQLVKQIEVGIKKDPSGAIKEIHGISIFPMVLLLMMIAYTIKKGWSNLKG